MPLTKKEVLPNGSMTSHACSASPREVNMSCTLRLQARPTPKWQPCWPKSRKICKTRLKRPPRPSFEPHNLRSNMPLGSRCQYLSLEWTQQRRPKRWFLFTATLDTAPVEARRDFIGRGLGRVSR